MSDHAVMGALIAAREYLRECASPHPSYGYYLGGDPRDFTPDPEVCTPEELEAHRVACAAWERGERPESEAHHHKVETVGEVTVMSSFAGAFGMGTMSCRDEDAEDVLDQVEAALSSLNGGDPHGT